MFRNCLTNTLPSADTRGRIAIMLTCLLGIGGAQAVVSSCEEPSCPSSNEPVPGSKHLSLASDALFRREAGAGSPLERRYFDLEPAAKGVAAEIAGDTLYGDFPGSWDVVSAYVTVPYSEDGSGLDQLLVRGLPTQALAGGSRYEVAGWTRSAYWIDTGDGVPRLLSTELIDPAYVPEFDDAFIDAGHLNFSQLVLYQEFGRDYSAYPEGGAFGSLFFVADPDTGEVLDAIVALEGANGEFEKVEYLFEGDRLKPLIISYRLDEPEFLYYAEYGDYVVLDEDFDIGLANHIPGVDFFDPDLFAVGFDADSAALNLLFEGFREGPGETFEWAYSEVQPLGYSWGEALEQLFASGFERGTNAIAKRAPLVRKRSD